MTETNWNTQSWQKDLEKWTADLAFCRDEVKILQRYLEDVQARPLSGEMKEDIRHFQTQLSDKAQKATLLLAEVTTFGQLLNSMPVNEENADGYSYMKERTLTFCHSYTALKSSFVKFLAKSEMVI